eukprot:INCI2758.2.p1 GENE.INCI2758.2~~INCI2758.2.p1  ORF type:complete len:961 (+),score=103.58 INCI2758.2:85-2967(+)
MNIVRESFPRLLHVVGAFFCFFCVGDVTPGLSGPYSNEQKPVVATTFPAGVRLFSVDTNGTIVSDEPGQYRCLRRAFAVFVLTFDESPCLFDGQNVTGPLHSATVRPLVAPERTCRRNSRDLLQLACRAPFEPPAGKQSSGKDTNDGRTSSLPGQLLSSPYLLPASAFGVQPNGEDSVPLDSTGSLDPARAFVVAFDVSDFLNPRGNTRRSDNDVEQFTKNMLHRLHQCVVQNPSSVEGGYSIASAIRASSSWCKRTKEIQLQTASTGERPLDLVLLRQVCETGCGTRTTGNLLVGNFSDSDVQVSSASVANYTRLNETEWRQVLATFARLSHEVLHNLQKHHTLNNKTGPVLDSSVEAVIPEVAEQRSQNTASDKPNVRPEVRPYLPVARPVVSLATVAAGERHLLTVTREDGSVVNSPDNGRKDSLEVLGSRNFQGSMGSSASNSHEGSLPSDPVNLDRLQSAEVTLLEITSKLNAMAEGRLGLHTTTIYEVIINPCIQVFETLMPEILYWLLKEPIVAIIEWILEHLAFPALFKGGMSLPWSPPGSNVKAAANARFGEVLPRGSACDPPCQPPMVCGPDGSCVHVCDPPCTPPMVCGADGICGCDPPCSPPLVCMPNGKCGDGSGRVVCGGDLVDNCPYGQVCVSSKSTHSPMGSTIGHDVAKTDGKSSQGGFCADAGTVPSDSVLVPRSFGRHIRIVQPQGSLINKTAHPDKSAAHGKWSMQAPNAKLLPAELAVGNGDAMEGGGVSEMKGEASFAELEAHEMLDQSQSSGRLLGVSSKTGMNLLQNYALSVADGVSSAMGDALQEKLGHVLAARIRSGVVRATTTQMTRALTSILGMSLTRILVESLATSLTVIPSQIFLKSLVPTLVHTLAPTITQSLLHRTQADIYCQYCQTHSVYCQLCDSSKRSVSARAYLSDYYGEYYAKYYTKFYATKGTDIFQVSTSKAVPSCTSLYI